jgi:transposase, IS6 family
MGRPRAARPDVDRSAFAGFRFPSEVITVAVRWYLRYGISYRDVEELLAERGVEVDHVTVYRWVQRFTPLFADAARPLLRVLDELVPAAAHITEQYDNNPIESDHARLKARLRPMRGLKRLRSAARIGAAHAFVQNLRRRHYELATNVPPPLRLAAAFTELAQAM